MDRWRSEDSDEPHDGSPCQDLSIAKANGKGLSWKEVGLFFEYMRLPHPRYDLDISSKERRLP